MRYVTPVKYCKDNKHNYCTLIYMLKHFCLWTSFGVSNPTFYFMTVFTFVPLHEKTNKKTVRPIKDQPGHLRQSSLCAQWIAKDPSFLNADSEDSDQTELMPRIVIFAGRTCHFVGFVMRWLSSLILSFPASLLNRLKQVFCFRFLCFLSFLGIPIF